MSFFSGAQDGEYHGSPPGVPSAMQEDCFSYNHHDGSEVVKAAARLRNLIQAGLLVGAPAYTYPISASPRILWFSPRYRQRVSTLPFTLLRMPSERATAWPMSSGLPFSPNAQKQSSASRVWHSRKFRDEGQHFGKRGVAGSRKSNRDTSLLTCTISNQVHQVQ